MKVYDGDGNFMFNLWNARTEVKPVYVGEKHIYNIVKIEGLIDLSKEETSNFEEPKKEGSWRDKPPML